MCTSVPDASLVSALHPAHLGLHSNVTLYQQMFPKVGVGDPAFGCECAGTSTGMDIPTS